MAHKGSFRGYWSVYGGLPSLLRSTYFWVSVVTTIVAYPYWSKVTPEGDPTWVAITFQVVPSLLGFALGGMAIMLAFSSGKFLEAIRQKGREDSYFLKVIASFFHFTLVLGLALLAALIALSFPNRVVSGVGFFTSVYGVLLAVATVDHLWQTATIFNKAREGGAQGNGNDEPS